MVINLAGGVDYEMLNALIKAFNDLKEFNILDIYFTSMGGQVDAAEAIIAIINDRKEDCTITFYGEVFSSGMQIFLKTECKKKLLPDTTGMYHYSWQEMIISEGGKPSGSYDVFAMKEMKKAKSRTIEYLKTTKLTDKEVNAIKAGKDVYFSYDRMQELISNG